ncbi:hypothetical protein GT370_07865 [Acidocella sp. MX-AZ03]|uniref:hypothetical protein n=1 Tax=Acidocella sp. MX-AZ03 TaxID=2697363 RepID=UPI0022DD75B7|nr:hypothetical protein [Acidocella sp. MX-AZ03]WBO60670.1 hypothetical protein GT370_07865 [Acidocella sp. MX-AZ03]
MLDALDPALPAHPFIALAPQRRVRSLAAFKSGPAALEAALGVSLPATPKRLSHQGADIIWNGPGQWLVLGELDLPPALPPLPRNRTGSACSASPARTRSRF